MRKLLVMTFSVLAASGCAARSTADPQPTDEAGRILVGPPPVLDPDPHADPSSDPQSSESGASPWIGEPFLPGADDPRGGLWWLIFG
jgi:hypothetical protein